MRHCPPHCSYSSIKADRSYLNNNKCRHHVQRGGTNVPSTLVVVTLGKYQIRCNIAQIMMKLDSKNKKRSCRT